MILFLKSFQRLALLFVFILAACSGNRSITTPTLSVQATDSALPQRNYQLTYVAQHVVDGKEYQGVFAADVQCLEKEALCFSSPQLLLKIPEQSGANPNDPYGQILSYSWSPDGSRIAFSAFSINGEIDIFIADWNGENMKNITMSAGSELYPSWSIHNQLTFIACSGGKCDGFISDENGANLKKLPVASAVAFVTWMPDGKNILFVGTDSKVVNQIFITDLDGVNINQVTHTAENNIVEDATTNGDLIFFTRLQTYTDNNFNYNIFSISTEGKMERAITRDKDLVSSNPSVAPLGNWIAFHQGRDTYDIYISSFDGNYVYKVTKSKGNNKLPGWRIIH